MAGGPWKELTPDVIHLSDTSWRRGDRRFRIGFEGETRYGEDGRYSRFADDKGHDDVVVSLDADQVLSLLRQIAEHLDTERRRKGRR